MVYCWNRLIKFEILILMKILNYIFLLSCALCLCACEDDEVMLKSTVSFKETAVIVSEDNTEGVEVPLELTETLKSVAIVYIEIDKESITGGILNGAFATYSTQVYLEAGSVRGNVFLNIIDNKLPNIDCSFDLKITGVHGGANVAEIKQTCKVTILDDDSKQKVSIGFDTTKMNVNEDALVVEVPVTVEGLLSDGLTFNVETVDGTAKAGDLNAGGDFELVTNKVRITEGENWGVVEIKIHDKAAAEENRTFKLKLTGVNDNVETDSILSVVRPESAECDITINKVVRKVMFADSVIIVPESTRNVVNFGVKLTAPVKEDVTITIKPKKATNTAQLNDNYKIDIQNDSEETMLVIKKGETLATTKITIIDDTLGNVHRYCNFEIVSAIGASGTIMETVSETSSRLFIENDDSAIGFGVTDKLRFFGDKFTLPIYLTGVKGNQVNIKVKSIAPEGADGSYFFITNKTVVVLPGDSIANLDIQILRGLPIESFDFGIEIVEIDAGLSKRIYRDAIQRVDFNVTKPVPIDKTKWTILASSPADGDATAAKIIDDDDNTIWHNDWPNGTTTGAAPWFFIIDMADETRIEKLRLAGRPGGHKDAQHVEAYISNENLSDINSSKWKKIVNWENPDDANWTQIKTFKIEGKPTARYLMIKILKGRYGGTDIGAFAEVTVNPI